MFDNMTEKDAREKITSMVSSYCKKYHNKNNKSSKQQKISYAGRIYDDQEMINLVDSSLDFWLTSGRYVDKFEKGLGDYLGVKYCSAVNSGSSANLIAFMTLTSPLLNERAIKRGDEVITVACGFPTTVTPILQFGAVPVFVDINIPQYNIDINLLEEAYSKKTKAVMIAHTLGNPFDISKVKEFCDKYGLWLIEDNCDALGSKYRLSKKDGDTRKGYTGTFGDIGTSSFYPPHHITTGEGGAVYTNNPLLNKIIRSLRDWGRDCTCASGQDNMCNHRFDGQYGELPKGYDHKYVYSHFGYNLKITEMQGAIGCAQLDKLDMFVDKRKKHFEYLKKELSVLSDKIILPQACDNSEPSWFGFMIMCKNNGDRNEIVRYLESNNIQTRMLFAGNLIKHPCFTEIRNDDNFYRVVGSLENTDNVMNNGFWIGVYPGMSKGDLDYMVSTIKEYFNKN